MQRGGRTRGGKRGGKRGGSTNRSGGSLLSELAVPGGLLVLNQLLKKKNKSKKNRNLRRKTLSFFSVLYSM